MEIALDQLSQGALGVLRHMDVDEAMRKRLLDFGMVEGTKIRCLRNEKGRGLKLYQVRGSMIALRSADSAMICVELCL